MKRWVWYVIGALVLALAGGGVLYGVLTHKEPGLMKVCWQSGQAVYTGDCQEVKWDKAKMPLPYYIDFEEPHRVYVDSVVKGAQTWNAEIGAVFKRVKEKKDALVIVSWGSADSGTTCAAGTTSHTGDESGPRRASVVLKEPSDIHAVYRFAMHEFGHVLGLAHDEAKRSIMYRAQPGMTKELKVALPSDFDKKLLRGLYR
jgi:hypothetical protein